MNAAEAPRAEADCESARHARNPEKRLGGGDWAAVNTEISGAVL